jgi:rhodanese-related sulfurtransferase
VIKSRSQKKYQKSFSDYCDNITEKNNLFRYYDRNLRIKLIRGNQMERQSYTSFVAKVVSQVKELFPWDVIEMQQKGKEFLFLDVRCPSEFQVMHIEGALDVPRGILEVACDYGYEETEAELVEAREKHIIVLCRSGNRSILAAYTMQLMGYKHVYSLKTGLRGWNDYELPLFFSNGNKVPLETADKYFETVLSTEQLGPTVKQVIKSASGVYPV